MDLKGKVAIVTGGASGIGFEFVKLLNSKDCHVVIADLRLLQESEQFAAEPTNSSAKVLFKKTDVSIWKELQELFEYTEKELGIADLVCPNAGIFEPKWSSFWEDTEDQSYKTLQINCEHPVKATRLAIRGFLNANKPGVVLHLSSIAAQTPALSVPLYTSSKAFISHFVRSLRSLDEMEKIRVIGIAPGLISTPLWIKENPEKFEAMSSTTVWIQPHQVAELMLNMVEDASYQGGTVMEFEGKARRVELFNDPGPVSLRAHAELKVPMRATRLDEIALEIIRKEKEEKKIV